MAVVTEMYSVVVRVATLAADYPGGAQAYEADCPNKTFCTDGEVCRVGFMSWADAERFLQSLQRFGMSMQSGAVAVVREDKGLLLQNDWLEFQRINGTAMARLAGSALNVMVAPPGWTAGHRPVLTTEADLQQRELAESKDGVDAYRDRTTGDVLYVGRAFENPKRPWWKIWN